MNQIGSENVSAKALDKDSVRCSCNIGVSGRTRKMGFPKNSILKRILRFPIDFFWWCVEYCDFAAETMKVIPILIMTVIIAEPGIYLLIAGLTIPLTPLWLKYILWAGMWLHFIVPAVALACYEASDLPHRGIESEGVSAQKSHTGKHVISRALIHDA